jgi:hypothetical protein
MNKKRYHVTKVTVDGLGEAFGICDSGSIDPTAMVLDVIFSDEESAYEFAERLNSTYSEDSN